MPTDILPTHYRKIPTTDVGVALSFGQQLFRINQLPVFALGGSLVPRYGLKLLFRENSQNC
jgi:hypothetical protein